MRLRRLELTRYGKFTDGAIDFGPRPAAGPDFHIVYGLNESGKSTAFSAFLDLLFGIEERSRYAFLHPYGAMRIGAELELGDRMHALVRIKQRAGSLLDRSGQPLNETLLGAPLAGLSREAYGTMFSLDDATLEAGGNAILASRGDLGRLLFSASAGLGEVSRTLAELGDAADAIYRKGARKTTQLAQLKAREAELREERKRLDTLVSAYATLVAEAGEAARAYQAAMAERNTARTRLGGIERQLLALPLLREREALVRVQGESGPIPDVPAGWAARLPGLMEGATRLEARRTALAEERARLVERLVSLPDDAPVLALGARLAALGASQARFATAEQDLPNRRATLFEHNGEIAAILHALDQPGHTDPRALLLPAALLGEFRDLMEARSGIDAGLEAAERELALARRALLLAAGQALPATGPVIPPEAESRLERTLQLARGSDWPARLRLAERKLGGLRPRAAAELLALRPFSGDGAALLAMALPSARQIEGWRTTLAEIETRRRNAGERLRELEVAGAEARARLAAVAEALGPLDDAEAARLRGEREAAWAVHRTSLEGSSAARFEAAMRADDALGEARLRSARDLSERRHLAEAVAAHGAGLAQHRALREAAEAEARALGDSIRAALPKALLPDGEVGPETMLDLLESWMARRQTVLATMAELAEAEADATEARTEGADIGERLAAALKGAGIEAPPDPADQAGLLERADSALVRAQEARLSAAASARRREEATAAVEQREAGLVEAQTRRDSWEARWAEALGRAWFGASATGIGAVRQLLETLGRLGPVLAERDGLAHRIAQMEADQRAFAAELEGLLSALGEAPDGGLGSATAEKLARRFERADRDREARQALQGDLARIDRALQDLETEARRHEAEAAEITAFFGVESLDAVAVRLQGAMMQRERETRIAALEAEMLDRLAASDLREAMTELAGLDAEALRGERDDLALRLENMEIRSRELYSEQTRAEDRLAAVGGDSAVARLEAQRRTVLLEIEERAVEHLRLKLGVLAAERALAAYRDTHRSSMMRRASEAFGLITRGAYRGLAVQPDKDGETLIGVAAGGGSRRPDEMSKGTRFQLYLALRLAGYYEFAEGRGAVPFIADDIMETFDEPRSEEVLRLFARMAEIGQVIYLTHHRHLCDLARDAVPGTRIHELV